MELIQETEAEKQQGALAEPEPRYHTANLPVKRSEHGQTWVRIAAATVAAVILVILIVLLARFIYHKAHNHATPSAQSSQNSPAVSSNQSKTSTAPSSSSKSTPNNSSSGSSNASNSKSGTQLTNTGPGNIMTVFVGSSLSAAGLHYVIARRRSLKDS